MYSLKNRKYSKARLMLAQSGSRGKAINSPETSPAAAGRFTFDQCMCNGRSFCHTQVNLIRLLRLRTRGIRLKDYLIIHRLILCRNGCRNHLRWQCNGRLSQMQFEEM